MYSKYNEVKLHIRAELKSTIIGRSEWKEEKEGESTKWEKGEGR